MKILGIAEYADAKQYVDEFIEMTIKQALLDCAESLSEEQLNDLSSKLEGMHSPDELVGAILQVVDQTLFQTKLAEHAKADFQGLIDAMAPHLDPAQAAALVASLQE